MSNDLKKSTPHLDKVNSGTPKKVKMNLIRQNCYIRDFCVSSNLSSSEPSQYLSLDEVVTSNGVEVRETFHDYPITPQYVNSFVESSDYRRDPAGAINKSSHGCNLGDIRDFQKVSKMDTVEQSALIAQLKQKFQPAQQPAEQPAEQPAQKSEV